MRLEHAGPRTRLLAMLAGLALLAWIVALAGAGGRVTPLPDDASLLPPLPSAAAGSAEALGPLPDYAAIGERPLFSVDRTHRPFFLSSQEGEPASTGFDYQLTSVILTPGLRMAIVQPTGGGDAMRVYEGAEAAGAPGWRLVTLDRRKAVFEGPEGRRELGLRVFNGDGSEAEATAVEGITAADAAAASAATAPSVDGGAAGDAAEAPEPDAAQIETIRQRIQARRARMQRPETQ